MKELFYIDPEWLQKFDDFKLLDAIVAPEAEISPEEFEEYARYRMKIPFILPLPKERANLLVLLGKTIRCRKRIAPLVIGRGGRQIKKYKELLGFYPQVMEIYP